MLSCATLWHWLVHSVHLRICVLTFFQGKERSPITGSFVQSTKASRDWKDTEGERRRKKKAFDSVIDEVFLFDFKDFMRRSGWVLALLLLFQWLKRSTWCASVLTWILPLLFQTKDPNNPTFSKSGPTCQWLFFPILRIFPPFPVLCSIHFY